MTRALLLADLVALLLAALVALLLAGAAQAAGGLTVTHATVAPETGVVRLTVTCAATRARCRGVLSMTSEYDGPVTESRRVRLVPRRPTRVALPLAPGGLAAAGADGVETWGYVDLQPARGSALEQQVDLAPVLTCRSGMTLASTAQTRVFEQEGFGVYACRRPSGTPAFVVETTDDSLETVAIADVVIAGPYVAYVELDSYKCFAASVAEFDVSRRRIVRERSAFEDDEPSANCQGTLPILGLVLRPSGSFAWVEGRAGAYAVRSADASGTRTIGTGAAIDGASLALGGDDAVTWLDGDVPGSGPLR